MVGDDGFDVADFSLFMSSDLAPVGVPDLS